MSTSRGSDRVAVSGMTAYDWACLRVMLAEADEKIASTNSAMSCAVCVMPALVIYTTGTPSVPWWIAAPFVAVGCWWINREITGPASANLKKATEYRDSFDSDVSSW